MQEIKITEQEAGQRFDKLLCKYLNKAPKSFLYKMLRKKNNYAEREKGRPAMKRLAKGDCVKLFLSDETIQKFYGKRFPAIQMSVWTFSMRMRILF